MEATECQLPLALGVCCTLAHGLLSTVLFVVLGEVSAVAAYVGSAGREYQNESNENDLERDKNQIESEKVKRERQSVKVRIIV